MSILSIVIAAVGALSPIAFSPELLAEDPGALAEMVMTPTANAQTKGAGGFVPLEDFEPSKKLAGAYKEGDFAVFLNRVFVGAIALGAILAVLRLAWAGFLYMGTDSWSKQGEAKEHIRETLLGLFLLLAIWLILNQINPQILSLNVTTGVAPGSTYDRTGEL